MGKREKTTLYLLGGVFCFAIVMMIVYIGVSIGKSVEEKQVLASGKVYEVYVSEKEAKESTDVGDMSAVTYRLKLHDEAEVYDMLVEKDDYDTYKKGDKVSVVKYDGKWLLKK
ncbi:hypothetical protein B4086_5749 [Bacillus cereus]|nr:hypothetical protein B4086_5749 [Bacillus cereus]